jgi:hypothetical protein
MYGLSYKPVLQLDRSTDDTAGVNRIAHLFESIDELLGSVEPEGAPAGLRIQRAPLITLVKSALGELHDHRRAVTGTTREADLEWTIRYWEEALIWLKNQQGRYLDMFSAME